MRTIFGLLVAAIALASVALGVAGLSVRLPASASAVPGLGATSETATVVFGGDMMFDRYIREVAAAQGGAYLFSCMGSVLSDADLAVANLEGPVTANPSVSVNTTPGGTDNMTFTFPTSTPALLFKENIRLVNIGNNHIMNFSRVGLEETKQYLSAAGVSYFGDPDAVEAERVARMEIRGIPVSFVNWSDWTSDNTDHTVAQVRAEKAAGRIVFVYTHWGEEYVPPPERVQALAHSFIDAGADLVIGSHPHIVQTPELYKGKYIYYSLGNFIFDQYWDDSVRNGLLLDVSFTRTGVSHIKEIPVRLEEDGRTCPDTNSAIAPGVVQTKSE